MLISAPSGLDGLNKSYLNIKHTDGGPIGSALPSYCLIRERGLLCGGKYDRLSM